MENIMDFMLYVGILGIMFMPVLLMTWFFESTRIGRRLWNHVLVPWLIKHDILPDDYWD